MQMRQEAANIYTHKALTLPESFTVYPELYVSQKVSTAHKDTKCSSW